MLVGAAARRAARRRRVVAAEDRASALADQIEADGLPEQPGRRTTTTTRTRTSSSQVTDESGTRWCWAAEPSTCPTTGYVAVSEDADRASGGEEYVVRVAASLEDVDESTAALVPLLLVGVPLLLLVVGGTTWVVVTRALAPVERIRREVGTIIGDERLDRRVPGAAGRATRSTAWPPP